MQKWLVGGVRRVGLYAKVRPPLFDHFSFDHFSFDHFSLTTCRLTAAYPAARLTAHPLTNHLTTTRLATSLTDRSNRGPPRQPPRG